MAAAKDLGIDAAKLNVNGGGYALGHPIGAIGARLVVTLLHALRRRVSGGIASLCIGGGEATAIAIERLGDGASTRPRDLDGADDPAGRARPDGGRSAPLRPRLYRFREALTCWGFQRIEVVIHRPAWR